MKIAQIPQSLDAQTFGELATGFVMRDPSIEPYENQDIVREIRNNKKSPSMPFSNFNDPSNSGSDYNPGQF